LLLIPAPNFKVRVTHWGRGAFHLGAEYGLYFPSPAFRLAPPLGVAGYLTPSCKVAEHDPAQARWCQRPGWFLVPHAALLFSWGTQHVLTTKLDAAVGILLAGERGKPLDTWAPVDLEFAPIFNLFKVHLGVGYDRRLLSWLRLRGSAHLWVVGQGPPPARNPWIFGLQLDLEFRLGRWTRAAIGLRYFNSDQRRTVVETGEDGFARRVAVRSHEFLPTFDFIWTWAI